MKQYKNLLGVTLGTGFGAGVVINQKLLLGDNARQEEISGVFGIRNIRSIS